MDWIGRKRKKDNDRLHSRLTKKKQEEEWSKQEVS